ncbi:MAG: phospholipase [Actinomycetota bacterium]|nr:phospholipase [Actinomycetota bacterium]
MALTRRDLLIRGAGLAGVAGAASVLGNSNLARAATRLAPAAMPPPTSSGVDHVVVLMMENRSFDHYFGWVPGADGRQAGLVYSDAAGTAHETYHLTDFQGCGHPDPDHSWEGGRIEYANGACDGWLKGTNDEYSIGYYTADDLPFSGAAAPYWTVCDHYFSAIMAETYPNRFYLHSAQTDRLHNSYDISTLPTIWDRLAAAGLDGRYYYSDAPFTALWGPKYAPISHPFDSFLADCAAGSLPSVAYVDPRFLDEGSGTSGDDHPHADIRVGQSFLNQVYQAVTTGPEWSRTVLVITYDEWGGFFDHVRPASAPDANPACRLRGFRVPTLVISPRARRHHVAHATYDHTSILKMIEWRWKLAPLTVRDAHARNLAEVLDFSKPANLTAPSWDVPAAVGSPCSATDPAEFADWQAVASHARRAGFRAQ